MEITPNNKQQTAMSEKLKSLDLTNATPVVDVKNIIQPVVDGGEIKNRQLSNELETVNYVETQIQQIISNEAILLDSIIESKNAFEIKFGNKPNTIVLSDDYKEILIGIVCMFDDYIPSIIEEGKTLDMKSICGMIINYTIVPNTVMCI